MCSRSSGFTLIELMIVVSVIAIIASVAVPNLVSSRLAANEAAAISTLRTIVTAQAQFRTTVAVDADQDGAGEYGTFGELSGFTLLNARGPGPAAPLEPPILGSPFGQIDGSGRARRSGYYFRIYLPDAGSLGLAEIPGGGPDPAVDPDQCGFAWSCYAWPANPNLTGNRAFFVDYRGELLHTRMTLLPYNNVLPPAFHAALSGGLMTTPPAMAPAAGQDGNIWTICQ